MQGVLTHLAHSGEDILGQSSDQEGEGGAVVKQKEKAAQVSTFPSEVGPGDGALVSNLGTGSLAAPRPRGGARVPEDSGSERLGLQNQRQSQKWGVRANAKGRV